MNMLQQKTLIAEAPPEILLVLGILFTLAALVLLTLAVEAGHYRDVTAWLRKLWPPRPQRRWMFNMGRPAVGRPAVGRTPATRSAHQARC